MLNCEIHAALDDPNRVGPARFALGVLQRRRPRHPQLNTIVAPRAMTTDERVALKTALHRASGIKKARSADSEESFDLTDRFGDHVVRLAGQKLVL
jgi:hypothetical protein